MIESASVGASAEFSSTEFDALLERYLHTSLRASLTEVRQQATLVPDEMRLRAWHLLSYALRTGKAWPETRDLLTTLAPKMEQAGFREEWIAYLVAGVEVATQHNDRAAVAEFALQIATLWRMLSEYDRAVQWLDSSLAGFRQEQDRRGEARALNELAWLEQLRGHYDDASKHVEQALALLDENAPERGICYRTQGMIAIYRGEWEKAEVLHRKALAIFERNSDHRRVAWSMVNIGLTLRGQQRFHDSVQQLIQATTRLNELDDEYNWLIAQTNLGIAYFHLGAIELSIECYLNAERVAYQLCDQLRLGDCQVNLGLAYMAKGSNEMASVAFQNAIEIYEQLGIQNLVINSMDGLAMSYIAQRFYDKAQVVLETAQSRLPKIANLPNYNYYVESLNKHLHEAIHKKELKFTVRPDMD